MMGVVTKTATLLERDSTDVVGRIAEAEIDLLSIDPIAQLTNPLLILVEGHPSHQAFYLFFLCPARLE